MMSPKSIARWQQLKAKKLSGRTVPEDMEYKKLQMKHDADVLALNELKWKAELAEAVMLSSMNNSNTQSMLDAVIQSGIGEEQKPYSRKDIADFVTDFLAKANQESAPQNHNLPLGNNPLKDKNLPNGSKHSN
ncbi:replication protein [Limosilactobacillus reuteri]|uniref:replication protein n=1 Tax=Limosilactobacillus reuteri TaxID=1598 RepID=UPI001E3C3404|nr:replication protein [Limosilactobacillus reuteri]MCC4491299.1 replication protein [Limosilactobacillus reuteri]